MCRERLERLINLPIENAYVSMNDSQILSQGSRGLVGVMKPNGEIEQEDVARALEQAQTIIMPPNYEVLHVLSKGYSVDSQPNIKDPVGMTGIRLEVDTLLIEAQLANLKNLQKCIYRTTLHIKDIVLGILANAELILTPRQKDIGSAVINIGAATTGVAVYEEGDLIHIAVLPIGADKITQDISLLLKISSFEVAERLKIKYGTADSRNVSKKEEINIYEDEEDKEEIISRKSLADIIEARVEEIFSKVNAELKKIGRAGLLPAGAILCGGGAKLDGIIEVAKRELKLPTAIGYPMEVSSVSEKINDSAFTTAISLVKWGGECQDFSKDMLGEIIHKIRNILKGGTESAGKWFGSIFK